MKNKKLATVLSVGAIIILSLIYITKYYSPISINQLINKSEAKWQTYNNSIISFDFPAKWVTGEVQVYGSTNEIIFKDPHEIFRLSYIERINYNNETGKPYSDFIEFIKIPYLKPVRQIDGYEIYQVLPRAGSEHNYAAYFFSKDGPILAIELDTLTQNEEERERGKKLFSSILDSFKFIDR